MGGIGSGRVKTASVSSDNRRSIDLKVIHGAYEGALGGVISYEIAGWPVGRLTFRVDPIKLFFSWEWEAKEYRCNDGVIELCATSCYFGGVRYWYICPSCERRAGRLYQSELGFYCRCWVGVVYQSTSETKRARALRRIHNIHEQLKLPYRGLCSRVPKPKGMHLSTYATLMERRARYIGEYVGYLPKSLTQPR